MPQSLLFLLLCIALLLLPQASFAASRWVFQSRLDATLEQMHTQACSATAQRRLRFEIGNDAGTFLLRAERSSGRPLRQRGDTLFAADWQADECLNTVVDLGRAGDNDRFRLGRRSDHFYRMSPTRWLWRPWRVDPDSFIAFDLPSGWAVSAPWAAREGGGFRLGATTPDWPAVVAFGRFREIPLSLPGGRLRLAVLPVDEHSAALQRDLRQWLEQVGQVLLSAYGNLPVDDVQLLVAPLPGVRSAVPWGQVTRGGGPAVHLFVGAAAGPENWQADWTAAHEFAHLLHPYLGDRGRWLAEGLASYQQNVLRARVGDFDANEAWRRLRAGFERGRRATPNDAEALIDVAAARARGSTMRVYWAGAAFWLETDIALRAAGSSLDALLRDFAARYLPSDENWEPERFAAVLQAIAPAAQIERRFQRYAYSRQFPDTDALLRQTEQLRSVETQTVSASISIGEQIMRSSTLSAPSAASP